MILSLCKLKKAEVLVRHLALHLASFIFLYTENNLLTLFLEIKPLSRGTYTYIYIYIYMYIIPTAIKEKSHIISIILNVLCIFHCRIACLSCQIMG